MVHAAVGVVIAARNRAGTPQTQIAASMAPVEDCYRPDLVPPDDELRTEHRWLATELRRAGVDLVLIEAMNSEREARIALAEVLAVGGRAWVSFVCDDGATLLSPIGRDGEFYLENVPPGRHRATIEDPAGRCAFTLEAPAVGPSLVDLGTLTCAGGGAR